MSLAGKDIRAADFCRLGGLVQRQSALMMRGICSFPPNEQGLPDDVFEATESAGGSGLEGKFAKEATGSSTPDCGLLQVFRAMQERLNGLSFSAMRGHLRDNNTHCGPRHHASRH